MAEQIHIYTDGSSLGNPGPGGYGVVMLYKDKRKELSAGYQETTNNRMELLAVIKGLKALNDQARNMEIVVFTDSKYVKDAIEKGWVYGWQKKGFKDKANPDLWRDYLNISARYKIKFEWVKGHSGNKENERCDQLAKKAAQSKDLKVDHGYTKPSTLL